jgi:hypothetical protein
MYIWQNTDLTYIVHSEHRDYATIEHEFPKGFPGATEVSDCYAAQLKTPAEYHQLCTAHLLRELANFETSLKSAWSTRLKGIIKEAPELKRCLTGLDYEKPPPLTAEPERRLDALVVVDYTEFHSGMRAFIDRNEVSDGSLNTGRVCLRFSTMPEVPAETTFLLITTCPGGVFVTSK